MISSEEKAKVVALIDNAIELCFNYEYKEHKVSYSRDSVFWRSRYLDLKDIKERIVSGV